MGYFTIDEYSNSNIFSIHGKAAGRGVYKQSRRYRYLVLERSKKARRQLLGRERFQARLKAIHLIQKTIRAHQSRTKFSIASLRRLVKALKLELKKKDEALLRKKEAKKRAEKVANDRKQWIEILSTLPPSKFRDYLTTVTPNRPYSIHLESWDLIRVPQRTCNEDLIHRYANSHVIGEYNIPAEEKEEMQKDHAQLSMAPSGTRRRTRMRRRTTLLQESATRLSKVMPVQEEYLQPRLSLGERDRNLLLSSIRHFNNINELVLVNCDLDKTLVRLVANACKRLYWLDTLRLVDCNISSSDFKLIFEGLGTRNCATTTPVDAQQQEKSHADARPSTAPTFGVAGLVSSMSNTNANPTILRHLRVLDIAQNSLARGSHTGHNKYGHPTYAIDHKGSDSLARILRLTVNSLRTLNLSRNRCGDGSLMLLMGSHVFAMHRTLCRLDLSYNNLTVKGAMAVAQVLCVNKTIQQLSLQGNPIGDQGVQELSAPLSTHRNLKILDLARTELSPRGAATVAIIIIANPGITQLSVAANNIGVQGLSKIASAAKVNDTIQCLNLSRVKVLEHLSTSGNEVEFTSSDSVNCDDTRVERVVERAGFVKQKRQSRHYKLRHGFAEDHTESHITFVALDSLCEYIQESRTLARLDMVNCGLRCDVITLPGHRKPSRREELKVVYRGLFLLLESLNSNLYLRHFDVRLNYDNRDYVAKIVSHYLKKRKTIRTRSDAQELVSTVCLVVSERALQRELTVKESSYMGSSLLRILAFLAVPRTIMY